MENSSPKLRLHEPHRLRSRSCSKIRTYNDWFLDRPFVIVLIQAMSAKFLLTMKDYPPSQTPGSFNLEKIQKQLEASSSTR
jgi:arylsulfatase